MRPQCKAVHNFTHTCRLPSCSNCLYHFPTFFYEKKNAILTISGDTSPCANIYSLSISPPYPSPPPPGPCPSLPPLAGALAYQQEHAAAGWRLRPHYSSVNKKVHACFSPLASFGTQPCKSNSTKYS